MTDKKIDHIGIHHQAPEGPFCVAIVFSDGKTALKKETFDHEPEAQAFVSGIRAGFDWAGNGVELAGDD